MSQNVGPLDAVTGLWMPVDDSHTVQGTRGLIDGPARLAWGDEEEDWDDEEDWDEDDDADEDDENERAEAGDFDDDWDSRFDSAPREPLHRRRHFRDDD
jgi:hypothetical protein